MILATIRQQIFGVINIAVPLILFYVLYPNYLATFWGRWLASLVVGLYLGFLSYQQTKKQADQLLYAPTGEHRKVFEDAIRKCGLSPENIRIRYSYADDSVALSMLNTVAVDPMLWKNIEDDPEAIKAKNVVQQFVVASLPESKKAFHNQIYTILSPQAQCFIFKHELGHFFYDYSIKRIMLTGLIGMLATFIALSVAGLMVGPFGGIVALICAMLIGGTIDLLGAYMSNRMFKVREEQKADEFAIRYSTPEELEAAAQFFVDYEKYAQEYRQSVGLPKKLSSFLTGHIEGTQRAQTLRAAVQRDMVG